MRTSSFSGQRVGVRWEAHEGSRAGPVAAAGTLAVDVALGTHVGRPVTFTPPALRGPLYLVLTASQPGEGELFHNADTGFE